MTSGLTVRLNDGGRSNYFKAKGVRDCAIRVVAIGMEIDSEEV